MVNFMVVPTSWGVQDPLWMRNSELRGIVASAGKWWYQDSRPELVTPEIPLLCALAPVMLELTLES